MQRGGSGFQLDRGVKNMGIARQWLSRAVLTICVGGVMVPAMAYNANVAVNVTTTKATIPTTAYGIHTSVYDNNFANTSTPARLNAIGVNTLRWPGGGYADVYHWSTHADTQFENSGNLGYVAANTDIGHFAKLLLSVANQQGIITVNYGSSLDGAHGGEPKEAAALVAYLNGSASSSQSIGVDNTGHDWRTIGYWASLRAAAPLATDDGLNFLRIAHPASLGVKSWEIGNEVFGNGYLGFGGESDWHYPYNGSSRTGQAALSPTAYGGNVVSFSQAMKAVDPTIKVGLVLGTENYDSWAASWDGPALQASCASIDFIIWHDYMGYYLAPSYTYKDPADELARSGGVAVQVNANQALINSHCGTHAPNIRQFVTETNGNPLQDAFVNNLFAADTYAGLLENGVANVDWLELHNTFLDSGDNPQGPYYAIQLVHTMEAVGDTAVAASTTNSLLGVHAAKKANGSIAVLLINKDPVNTATVTVTISGATLQTRGTRYTFNHGTTSLQSSSVSGVGASFTATVPAYSIALYVIP
jgi:hypothetical protein